MISFVFDFKIINEFENWISKTDNEAVKMSFNQVKPLLMAFKFKFKFKFIKRFKHRQREDKHCSQLATAIRGEQWF